MTLSTNLPEGPVIYEHAGLTEPMSWVHLNRHNPKTVDHLKGVDPLVRDALLQEDTRPGDITVHWANQWKHIDYWTMRFIVGATQQIGNDPADGLQIQTRASAMTSLSYGPKIGLELFSEYGSTSDWLDANEQEHEFGPVAVWKLNEDWNLYSGALFGLTDASADSQLRFRLSKGF